MANKNRKDRSKKTVVHKRSLYDRGKKSRKEIKEQEVAQEGNVENLENDEISTR